MKTGLFIIDPQNDFCNKNGSLYVEGADKDIQNISTLIKNIDFDSVFVSLDTHTVDHIAHQKFWINFEGKQPDFYTVITLEDMVDGRWFPAKAEYKDWAFEYLTGLAKKGKFPLIIWPYHCLKDSWGAEVATPLVNALFEKHFFCQFEEKGMNNFTENYSVFEAEYPDPNDSSTFFNDALAYNINLSDKIVIAGEARTHCVLNSIESLMKHFGDDFAKKLVILSDCMSNVPIPSAVENADKFFKDLEMKGATITSFKDLVC